MSDFELNYNQQNDYYNKIVFSIKLQIKPTKVDMDAILDAIETIENFANKYLKQTVPLMTKESK